jgi:hypothetical protein
MLKMRWILLGLVMPLTASAAELTKLNDIVGLAILIAGIIIPSAWIAAICFFNCRNSKATPDRRHHRDGGGDGYVGGWGDGGGDGGGCGGGGD